MAIKQSHANLLYLQRQLVTPSAFESPSMQYLSLHIVKPYKPSDALVYHLSM